MRKIEIVEMTHRQQFDRQRESGVALLAVLWLTVALTMMAMATSQLVRTEVSAVTNQMDSERSYYLARGGIEAAIDSVISSNLGTGPKAGERGLPNQFSQGKRWLQFSFPGGNTTVEVVPENAKLNINTVSLAQLNSIFLSLGLPEENAKSLADAVIEWRTPPTSEADAAMSNTYYLSLPAPYKARRTTIQTLDELLPVRGMTRRIFFGRAERNTEGEWRQFPDLAELFTTSQTFGINVNYAPFEVLRVLPGMNDSIAAEIIAARDKSPITTPDELQAAVPQLGSNAAAAGLTFYATPEYTLTATGSVPGSNVRRTVRARVLVNPTIILYHRILGWWDEWPTPRNLPSVGDRKS